MTMTPFSKKASGYSVGGWGSMRIGLGIDKDSGIDRAATGLPQQVEIARGEGQSHPC